MSNEVNQAYLRAYIKNRVANAKPQEVSSPLPTKQSVQPNGQVENTFRRVDAGRAQAPSPRSSRMLPESAPTSRPQAYSNEQPSAIDRAEMSGVWSPMGVERGMKGAGMFRSQPAAVVNNAPANVVHTPARSLREAYAEQSNEPALANPLLAKLPATNSPKAPYSTRIGTEASRGSAPVENRSRDNTVTQAPARQATSPLPSRVPTVRLDPGHAPAPNSHLRSPATHAPTQAPSSPRSPASAPARSAPSRENAEALERDALIREAKLRAIAAEQASQSRVQADDYEEARRESRVPQISAPAVFNPCWEVDRLFWPEVLYQLEQSDRSAFELIGRHLQSANKDGLKVMSVTSGERGVGRSTVTMHLARAAAAVGLRVALVDADTGYPSLIDQLRLDMQHGWQDSLFENVPLEEVSVRSEEDNITVFPLTSVIAPQQLHANLSRVAKVIKRIASTHDIVFLDSNRLNLEQRDLAGNSQDCVIDAAIVVVDTELSIKEKVDTAIGILHGMGIASVGMVENFHA